MLNTTCCVEHEWWLNAHPYKQARDSQVRKGENLADESKATGIGIGLPLSYNITNALGGELTFTSEPGKATLYDCAPSAWSRAPGPR